MSDSILSDVSKSLYSRVRLRIRLRDRILAGIPKNQESLDWFLKARHMSEAQQADLKARIAAGSLTDEEKEEVKNAAWCEFEKNHDGDLCIWHGNFKALLREMFTTLGMTQKAPQKRKKGEDGKDIDGAAGGRQTFQHGVHIDPLRPKFLRDNKPLKQPDGYVDRVKHIQDAAGRRSALGRHDYLDKVEIELVLKWPKAGVFTIEDMKRALAGAEDDGIGASRSQGFGKFDVVALEEL